MKEPIGYVICDLDGCLSDDRWRRKLLPSEGMKARPHAYDEYHRGIVFDEIVEEVRSTVQYCACDDNGEQRSMVLLVTTRPDIDGIRDATIKWLNQKFTINSRLRTFDFCLLMRPEGCLLHSPELKMSLLNDYFNGVHENAAIGWSKVVAAFDDRMDVLKVYPMPDKLKRRIELDDLERSPEQQLSGERITVTGDGVHSVPEILRAMADTFAERNEVYSDNYLRVAPIIRLLWPEGVPSELVTSDRWHLFELLVVKLTRFAVGDLTHIDSIHDAAIYAAMIESDLRKR